MCSKKATFFSCTLNSLRTSAFEKHTAVLQHIEAFFAALVVVVGLWAPSLFSVLDVPLPRMLGSTSKLSGMLSSAPNPPPFPFAPNVATLNFMERAKRWMAAQNVKVHCARQEETLAFYQKKYSYFWNATFSKTFFPGKGTVAAAFMAFLPLRLLLTKSPPPPFSFLAVRSDLWGGAEERERKGHSRTHLEEI